jgi:hypothetical protein
MIEHGMTLCCIFKEKEDQNHLSAGNIMRPVFWDAEGCTVVNFLPRKEIVSAVHYIPMLHTL